MKLSDKELQFQNVFVGTKQKEVTIIWRAC